MVSVRNPLAGFAITILGTVALSFLVGIPILLLPRDLVYFYLPFALFAVGVFSGRTTFLGSLGFMGALIGGIVGVYAFQALFLPAGWPLTTGVPVWLTGTSVITILLFGSACGLGGAASGKLGLKRIERLTERAPKMRRCLKCGAKVGVSARKCWSCRSFLPPT
jgi:ribosomal protein L40E